MVHRSDGSGTTYNFTNYLSKVSPQWRDTVGSDLLVKWPGGTGAKGNDGISRAVRQTKNSIGYVEYAHAMQTRLSYAALRNRAGQFVVPTPERFQAAAAERRVGQDQRLRSADDRRARRRRLSDRGDRVRADAEDDRAGTRARHLNFFQWSLDKGAKDAAELGYVPLPQELVAQVKQYWSRNLKAGS